MRKRVITYCPGSCGELIQGLIKGKELLISYPIELSTTLYIELSETEAKIKLMPKIEEALRKTLNFLGIPERYKERIVIRRESLLAFGKGMSSSTADIASTILGIGALFDAELDNNTIADIAVSIEPTDSIVFEDLTLFDSLKGEVALKLAPVPHLKVVVLEGKGSIDTLEYHSKINNILYSYAEEWEDIYLKMEYALRNGDWFRVGESAIRSARIQQKILPKPYLEDIIECALDSGAYGINVAHSGTAVGIFMSEEIDESIIIKRLKELKIIESYGRFFVTSMIKGGPRIIG
jgi:L-threonine kinase